MGIPLVKTNYFSELVLVVAVLKGFVEWDMHNFLKFSSTYQISEKYNYPISRKHPDRCQGAGIDRAYFIGSFQLLPVV